MDDNGRFKKDAAAGESPPGDMDPEEFRRYAHRVVDWIADYLAHPERYPVLAQVEPGFLKDSQPDSAPAEGEQMQDILADLDRLIVPGITHWNHPGFFAYFANTGSGPGILGEMLAAAFNVNAMLWRTSPAATELEEVTTNWLRRMMGLPEEFQGVIYDTASVSTLCAIAAAREAVPGLHVRTEGLAFTGTEGTDERLPFPGLPFAQEGAAVATSAPPRLRLYASEHAHSSVEKAAITLGIGQAGVRKIAADADYRMDADALALAIDEDRINGWLPFCVVPTVGTTSTTSIDPVPQVADICEREGLWMHVDAAYGGSAAVVPEMRWILEGCGRADSLVVNPHKWLFTPVDISVLFCQRLDVLGRAFSLTPEYLRTAEQGRVKNFMDYGPQLGRRFRALKLWFVMRYFGADGLAERIRYQLELARRFAGWVDASKDFERLAPVPFSTVCFRAFPEDMRGGPAHDIELRLEGLNERLLDEVNRAGKVHMSHTKLAGRYTLRLAIGNVRTTEEYVKLAWDELNRALATVRPGA